jgi:hypothetical protein
MTTSTIAVSAKATAITGTRIHHRPTAATSQASPTIDSIAAVTVASNVTPGSRSGLPVPGGLELVSSPVRLTAERGRTDRRASGGAAP